MNTEKHAEFKIPDNINGSMSDRLALFAASLSDYYLQIVDRYAGLDAHTFFEIAYRSYILRTGVGLDKLAVAENLYESVEAGWEHLDIMDPSFSEHRENAYKAIEDFTQIS